jgi:hypothetical protein
LIESELKSAPEDEVTSPEGVVSDKITSLQLTRALSAAE